MSRVGIICAGGIMSGREIMALELGRGLRDQSHSVEFVTSFWGDGEFYRRILLEEFRAHVIRLGFISATLTFPAIRMTAHQLFYWPALLFTYGTFLKAFKPDRIVHTNWHHLILLSPVLQPRRDIYWVHEVLPDKLQYRKVFGWLQGRIKCFVVVSHAVAHSLKRIGIDPARIHVIHNGIDDPSGDKTPPRCQSAPFRIGIVGQIGEWKGHDDLVEALHLLRQKHQRFELHIFGRGATQYETQLSGKILALDLTKHVFLHGFSSDRTQIYECLDVCVVPSRSDDPLPTTAIEAGFFQKPVIATRRGGLPEIIEDGVTGFLVDAANPLQIAYRLEELMNDESLRFRLGRQARSRMINKFGRKQFVEEFALLLHENKCQ